MGECSLRRLRRALRFGPPAGAIALSAALAVGLAAGGCGPSGNASVTEPGAFRLTEPLRGTRGYILISIDTLRADHLSSYGYARETSPAFDALGELPSALFEHAVVPYPSTLTSHISMLTGLHPVEHGAFPPSLVLSEEVPMLAERLRDAGFRTAGHTEGGYVAGGYGFSRGFDRFTDDEHRDDRDIETTFDRGLEFLRDLAPEDPFFLFLHTYSTHDPYEPPEEFRAAFRAGANLPQIRSDGPTLKLHNRRELTIDAATVEDFESLYDGGIRYADSVLARFVAELETLELLDDLTLIVTSDHGEEFGEHARLGHTQLYPEILLVPLLVVHPDLPPGTRVGSVVESLGIGPTIEELAGLDLTESARQRSLLRALDGTRRTRPRAYAVNRYDGSEEALVSEEAGGLHLLRLWRPPFEPDGLWIEREVEFHSIEPRLSMEIQSFHRPRDVEVWVDDERIDTLRAALDWSAHELALPRGHGLRELRLVADGCDSPRDLGVGTDVRCLSFRIRELDPRRIELFDLERDPLAQENIAAAEPDVLRQLARSLTESRPEVIAQAQEGEISEGTVETLRALGYID